MEALRRPTKPRAITSELCKRVIGEVEVEQRGRQDGEEGSRRLGRRFRGAAYTFVEVWMRAAAVAVLASTCSIHLLVVCLR